jgi:hypothetical protein
MATTAFSRVMVVLRASRYQSPGFPVPGLSQGGVRGACPIRLLRITHAVSIHPPLPPSPTPAAPGRVASGCRRGPVPPGGARRPARRLLDGPLSAGRELAGAGPLLGLKQAHLTTSEQSSRRDRSTQSRAWTRRSRNDSIADTGYPGAVRSSFPHPSKRHTACRPARRETARLQVFEKTPSPGKTEATKAKHHRRCPVLGLALPGRRIFLTSTHGRACGSWIPLVWGPLGLTQGDIRAGRLRPPDPGELEALRLGHSIPVPSDKGRTTVEIAGTAAAASRRVVSPSTGNESPGSGP